MRLLWFLLFLTFITINAMEDAEPFPDSLARVDIINSFPHWYSLVSLNQRQKDDALDQICRLGSGYYPWTEKRALIAAAIYAGADPNLPNSKHYNSPLVDACNADDFQMVQFLCNHGAKPDLVDPSLEYSRLLMCTRKVRIARYLVEQGACLKSIDVHNLLHYTMNEKYSSKLVTFYLDKGAEASPRFAGITLFHELIRRSEYYEEDDPRLFKKCNILLTYLPDEDVVALLNTSCKSSMLVGTPEEYGRRCYYGYGWSSPKNNNALKLSTTFENHRKALEEKLKARHRCDYMPSKFYY